jgi:hypothetical protein
VCRPSRPERRLASFFDDFDCRAGLHRISISGGAQSPSMRTAGRQAGCGASVPARGRNARVSLRGWKGYEQRLTRFRLAACDPVLPSKSPDQSCRTANGNVRICSELANMDGAHGGRRQARGPGIKELQVNLTESLQDGSPRKLVPFDTPSGTWNLSSSIVRNAELLSHSRSEQRL